MYPYIDAKSIKDICKMLGLPESHAPIVKIRRNLIFAILGIIRKKGLTQALAAEKAGVGRTVITAIVNGKVEKISTDKLLDVANKLGISFQLEIT